MNQIFGLPSASTGLAELDALLGGLCEGDGVVWTTREVEVYARLCGWFARQAAEQGRACVYYRFARHEALLGEDQAETVRLGEEGEFEGFLKRVHGEIARRPAGTCHVFDVLSDYGAAWNTDAMLVNFFRLTFPLLGERRGVGYFGLRRGAHSFHAVDPIQRGARVYAHLQRRGGKTYVLPARIAEGEGTERYLLHEWDGERHFRLVRSSATIADVMGQTLPNVLKVRTRLEAAVQAAEEVLHAGQEDSAEGVRLKRELRERMVTRDAGVAGLAARFFSLGDLVQIYWRMIGTGLIGGKTVGMLLARKIAEKECRGLHGGLEAHDSFFIGSDVFYTFLVRNGLWGWREKQSSRDTFLDGAEEARERIMAGRFQDHELRAFERLVDYFGQYPIIVRSSSLLEDNYGNSFAGKYESVFCANQGTRAERLREFLDAVRTVYASAMGDEALRYRERNGLLGRDEQMALLVMRVTGSWQEGAFYPHLAGVGFSYNPFAWDRAIDPKAGVLRLVYGLGTRAVDRVDDDYTRVVALNAPSKRPEGSFDEIARHSQRKAAVVDLRENRLALESFENLARGAVDVPLGLFATEDGGARFLTFEGLLRRPGFTADFRELLSTLERVYGQPVDVEFAVNFTGDGERWWINLLQCRPLQVRGLLGGGEAAGNAEGAGGAAADCVLRGEGAVVGHGRREAVDWVVLVRPDGYAALGEAARHRVARVVGQVNERLGRVGGRAVAIAPGRWGTHMASLGVPVRFSEISHFGAICEIMAMHEGLVPDVSLGTHFFGELVESNMLYFAVFPDRPGNTADMESIERVPNQLGTWVPDAAEAFASVVVVARAEDVSPGGLDLEAHSARQAACLRRVRPERTSV